MLFSILKDSIILFLLIYALLTLAEKLSKFLERTFEKHPQKLFTYRIIDIRDFPASELEIPLKRALNTTEEHTILLAENLTPEAEYIMYSLIQGNECIHLVDHGQLQTLIVSPKEIKDFFTRGDGHSCHSSRSIFS